MKIEELVPPIDLCKKIPAGEFADSALCWVDKGHACVLPDCVIPPEQHPFVELRRYTIQGDEIPAPTLQDLIIALSDISYYSIKIYEVFNEWNVECLVEYGERFVSADSSYNPATAALKLWLKLKGVEG